MMKQYSLGPNGGILTSLNLFATRFDQVSRLQSTLKLLLVLLHIMKCAICKLWVCMEMRPFLLLAHLDEGHAIMAAGFEAVKSCCYMAFGLDSVLELWVNISNAEVPDMQTRHTSCMHHDHGLLTGDNALRKAARPTAEVHYCRHTRSN